MSYSMRQVALSRVSLELNSHSSNHQNQHQNRASLCYSANLKKRTDVLNAQRQGIAQFLQKPQINTEKHIESSKNLSPPFYPQKRYGHLFSGSKSLYHRNQPVQSIKAIQQIKVQAKRCQNNDKHSQQKKIKDQTLYQYGTITSQVFEDDQCKSPTYQVDPSQFIKTCPDFGMLNNQKKSKKKYINNNETKNKNKIQSLIYSKNRQKMNTKLNGQSNKFILKESNYAKKRLTENIISMKDIQRKLDLFPQKRHCLNRVETAPNSSTAPEESIQDPSMRVFQNPYHKQIYKTNNVNLSEHFSNVKQRGSFPTCKKMTMSSVNKYYQLCIQQIKTRGMKKGQANPQSSQRINPGLQKNNSQDQKLNSIEFKEQLINLQSFNNTEEVINNKKSFQETKTAQKSKIQIKNKQDLGKLINCNQFQHKNNINLQINKQKQIEFGESQTDHRPLVATTKVSKVQKQQGKHVRTDVQRSIDKDQSLYFVRCSKKQLVDRVSILDPYKKNVFNNINKGELKKINANEIQKQQYFCQTTEPNSPMRLSKLNRRKSTSPQRKLAHQILQEAPLAAWDLHQNVDQNYPNHQFNLQEIN